MTHVEQLIAQWEEALLAFRGLRDAYRSLGQETRALIYQEQVASLELALEAARGVAVEQRQKMKASGEIRT